MIAFFTPWKLKVVNRNLYFWYLISVFEFREWLIPLWELLYSSPCLCFIYILQCHVFQPQASVSLKRAPPYSTFSEPNCNLIGVFTCQSYPCQQLTQMNPPVRRLSVFNHILLDVDKVLDVSWPHTVLLKSKHKEDVWWINSLSFCYPLCNYDMSEIHKVSCI